jgi:phosphatidate cytidylyltransferase
MLKHRLLSGACLIAFVLGLFWADGALSAMDMGEGFTRTFHRPTLPPGLLLVLVTTVLIPLAAGELKAIFAANGIAVKRWLIASAAFVSAFTVWAIPQSAQAPTGVAIIATVLIGCFISTPLWQSRYMRVEGVVAAAGATMFAVAYLGLMAGFYLAMRRWHAPWVVLGVILITKSGDIGAYFTGRAIGKHKLIPWLSPGKTWEGLFGGVVLASLVACGFALLTQHTHVATMVRTHHGQIFTERHSYHAGLAALGGAILALVGHGGDLTMSLFKRDSGLKDSGSIIPGMGGVLDVLDSPLLVAPFAYWMLELASR